MRSWVEVSRTRIRENYRAVRALVGENVEVMPVVKADAYRHGAIEISRVCDDARSDRGLGTIRHRASASDARSLAR